MLTKFNPDILEVVPEFLANLPRWLLWTAEPNGKKKPRKIPRYAVSGSMRNGKLGSEKDISNLVTLQVALESQKTMFPLAGIGFAFIAQDGIVGIDLDECIDKDTGEFTKRSEAIGRAANSYTEYSPSGNGIHIITLGQTTSAKCSQIEIYPSDRFFCFTGNSLSEYPNALNSPDQKFWDMLHRTVENIKSEEQKKRNEKLKSQTVGTVKLTYNIQEESGNILNALSCIPASMMNDDWVQIGMALKAYLGDSGYKIWDDWSRTSPEKYAGESDMQSRWKSFKREGVSIGTLYHVAKQNGFVFPKSERKIIEQPNEPSEQYNEPKIEEPEKNTLNESDPIDIFGVFVPPELPYEYLPNAIIDYVRENSKLIGTNHAVIALGALVAAAACIDDGIKIQPKKFDTSWKESARIWGAVVGDPSSKKSPGFSCALREVKKISMEMSERNTSIMDEYRAKHDIWKSIKKLDQRGPEPKEPRQDRLYVEDTTVEALSNVLRDNKRGILSFTDELTAFFGAMDAYKGASSGASKDKAHWLEAYNGGPRQIDRITRGSMIIPNWSVSVLGGIQPDAIRRVCGNMSNDGLLQRFIIICPPRAQDDLDQVSDKILSENYSRLFRDLVALEPNDDVVLLTEEAHECRLRIKYLSEKYMDAFESPHVKAWLGKWTGLFARLCLLYHTIECVASTAHPVEEFVSGETAQKVENLMTKYLLHHAIYFYNSVLDIDEKTERSRQVARMILARNMTEITKRDLMRFWKIYRKLEGREAKSIMDTLQNSGWIMADMTRIDEAGQPKAWRVNTRVHELFKAHADTERERREKSREVLKSISST